ncbi:MAG: endonuclease NucS domain-containing protein [Candidatus Thorarchaeota archaeon]
MVSIIEVWQIKDGKLSVLDTTMVEAGRKEEEHLQEWVVSHPELIGSDIRIIGREVRTDSNKEIDILGLDGMGNTVIIELKRSELPRRVLAQAIDYASDVARWDLEKLSEVYREYIEKHQSPDERSHQSLEEFLTDEFDNPEEMSWNQTQRIILVGTAIEDNLQRMIEWLTERYNLVMNFVLLRYIKTEDGEEFLARTVMFPEKVERERVQRQQRKILDDSPVMIEIDGTRCEGGFVYRILTCTAEWLISEGKLTEEVCPITVGKGKKCLINSTPFYENGVRIRRPRRLPNGLFIDTSFNIARAIRMAKGLLEYFDYSPDILKLEYEESNLGDNDD